MEKSNKIVYQIYTPVQKGHQVLDEKGWLVISRNFREYCFPLFREKNLFI